MRAADLPALVELWVASWNATMPEIDFMARADWLRDRLAAHAAAGVAILCAVDRTDRPTGFITVDPTCGHIDQLAIRLADFGTGLAASLLAAARDLAPGRLALEVNQENPRAVRFYEREGFTIAGEGTIGANRRKTYLMRWSEPRGQGGNCLRV